ncbi:brorin-like [Biomphalaria glabrata]|uniref:Brorin-like n=1 Tax=Biomphalaria glabrata TaxID=6526 RepID=A0A9U8E853_BIOGL|nr:brorin-like [Biomphalaria glabrata]
MLSLTHDSATRDKMFKRSSILPIIVGVCLLATQCDAGKVISCKNVACQEPPCMDSVLKSGECCKSCPNGPNCSLDGFPLALNSMGLRSDGLWCECSYTSSFAQPTLDCLPNPEPS